MLLYLSSENQIVTQSQTTTTPENKDLTQYSDRPDTTAILDILAERHKKGNTDKTFPVDLEYILELREFWNTKTCMTFEQFEHGPDNLRHAESRVKETSAENAQLRDKLKELFTENAIMEKKLVELRVKAADASIVKLPVRKINVFLKLCKDCDLQSDDAVFYVKINEKGDLERMVRSTDEL